VDNAKRRRSQNYSQSRFHGTVERDLHTWSRVQSRHTCNCHSASVTLNYSLPKYAVRLDALHQALVADFRRIVAAVPLRNGQTVVDVGCGDGFFSNLLGENQASVIGLDNSEAFLQHASANADVAENIKFLKGDVRRLPFEDASIDVIWSAHSMHSYPEIQQCLCEFRRVLRPGGVLAVLESDNVHSVMLSWAPDLELAVRQAEHREIGDEDSYIGTYFPRFAARLLKDGGFEEFAPQYFLLHRFGPAGESLTEFIKLYLENLLERTAEDLNERMKSRLALLADPTSDKFLPRQTTFFFGSLQILTLARAPERS
jgi:ubiquinone/menaquinone biosynthesis C-methylase UbiE